MRRTLAILLTIALGCGALFAFQGFIQGVLTNYQESTIHSHYGNGQFNMKGYRETTYPKPWEHWIPDWYDLKTELMYNQAVDYVFPRVPIGAMLVHGKKSATGQGQGIDAANEAQFFDKLNVEQGAMLTDQKNGILLGKGLASALGVKPGDKITLYTKSVHGSIAKGNFVVTGIFHTGMSEFDNRVFRIPLSAAQNLLDTNLVESISVGLKNQTYWKEVSSNLLAKHPELEAASFAKLDKIYYKNSVDWLSAQFYVVQMIIVSIVLLGIFNTISTSILERKQEIGNLRANGESAWDIMKMILCEGVLLGLIGSAIGLMLTAFVAKVFLHKHILMPPGPGSTRQFFLSFYFTAGMALYTLLLSVFSALVASFLAGLKTVRMSIAKALRSH